VQNAAAGGHPLALAAVDHAAVAKAVLMFDAAGDQVGDGFDAPVRMGWKPGQVVLGVGGVKRIQLRTGSTHTRHVSRYGEAHARSPAEASAI
jgi:hypothetical protein